MKKVDAIIIMDGFGKVENKNQSAIKDNNTKNIQKLMNDFPMTYIGASGMQVGLPDGQMGNSEVGHLNIGAGRIVYQELTRITKSISDGDFFANKELLSAIENVKANNSSLHLMGLLSDGGVHSHIDHLLALIKLAKKEGLKNVYVHCFMDGRDVSPTSGVEYIKKLHSFMKEENFGQIATIIGRYYAMDRDNRWDRVESAYNAMTLGEGDKWTCGKEAMEKSYADKITDEFIKPMVMTDEKGEAIKTIDDNDSIIFFNFRPDRARQITRAFADKNFTGFDKKKAVNVKFVCMTQYDVTFLDKNLFNNVSVAFLPSSLDNTLGEYLAKKNYKQFRIAETEKYAHVTFFFNGGVEKCNDGEDRILVASPKVATYDLKPEMSAYEVADKAVEAINSGKYDVMILNFANCDMVGHTGIMEAAEKAVSTVDECIKKVTDAILSTGGSAIVTADHGNADKMLEDDGAPFTAHTTNEVPVILVSNTYKNSKLKDGGKLADLAPTLLDVMNEEIPAEMTGKSLLVR